MKDKDPISDAAAKAVVTHPPLMQAAFQDLDLLRQDTPAQKLPVFGVSYDPASVSLDGCAGFASDEHEALKLVQGLPETQETVSMMTRQFGVEYRLAGIKKERMIIKDEKGPHYSSTLGNHRYQEIYRAYLDRSGKTDE